MKKFILFTVYCLLFTNLFSAFQDIGFSARAEGMGGVYASRGFDSTVLFYNPAGASFLNYPEASFMFFKPYFGLDGVNWNYYYLSGVYPLSKFNLGTAIGMYDADSLYSENIFIFSFSMLKNNLGIGANLKILTHKYNLDEEFLNEYKSSSKTAFTLDTGINYSLKNSIKIGFSLENIIPADVGLKEEDLVPLILRFGASRNFNKIWKMDDFLVGTDFVLRDGELSYRFGVEGWFMDLLGARAGFNDRSLSFGLSYIFGIGSNELEIVYSFSLPFGIGDNFGSHRIQTVFRFFGKEKEEIEEEEVEEIEEEEMDEQELKKRYFNRATEYFLDGEYEKAIEYWEKVLEIDPNHELSKKKIEKARKLLEEEEFLEEE